MSKTNYLSFGEYLKSKRIESGFTDLELAMKINVNLDSYNKVEQGLIKPSYFLFVKLKNTLNLDELICISLLRNFVKEGK